MTRLQRVEKTLEDSRSNGSAHYWKEIFHCEDIEVLIESSRFMLGEVSTNPADCTKWMKRIAARLNEPVELYE